MEEKRRGKFEFYYHLIIIILFELFYLGSLIYLIVSHNYSGVLLALGMMILTIIPDLICKLFKVSINDLFYLFLQIYFLLSFLGHGYGFYDILPWWDNMLHFVGGVVFFIVGYFLIIFINKKNGTNLLTKVGFALCLSISIAALWEFIEFGTDLIFKTDMQNDTFISSIHSYLLGDDYVIGHIDQIEEVIVNGKVLEGYIDIGLFDTMTDMIVETLGALFTMVIFILDKERHPLIKLNNLDNENLNKV